MDFVRSMEMTTTATPEAVFGLVSDIRRHRWWAANRLAVTHVSGPVVGEGARYASVVETTARRGQPQRVTGLIEVIGSHPHQLFVYECTDPSGCYRWIFEMTAWNGETLVTHNVERLTTPGWLRWTQPITWAMVGSKQMRGGLANLKELAERPPVRLPEQGAVPSIELLDNAEYDTRAF